MVKLPIIVGPTAVGKTQIACEVAASLGAEIVSADSRQVYKLMDIGTAKPSPELREGIPHWLLDLVYPDEDYSAANYARDATKVIDRLVAEENVPLVVGGSGLYIRALVDGFFEAPKVDKEIRKRLQAENHGVSLLHKRLKKVDPEAAGRIHSEDLQRIVRALEVYEQTGVPISQLQKSEGPRRLFHPLYIGLQRERKTLYRRIEERVNEMIEGGFVDEVQSLLKRGYSPELNSFSAVGYREMADYVKGNVDLKEAVRLTVRNTKRYAKRQLTWFTGMEGIHWMEVAEERGFDDLVKKIVMTIEEFLAR